VTIEEPNGGMESAPMWPRRDDAGPEEQALLDRLPQSRRLRRLLSDLDTLMAREGFLHLSSDQIATRLRCSKASLYRLAPTLEDLFELAIRLRFARTSDASPLRRATAQNWTDRLFSNFEFVASERSKLSYQYMKDLYEFPHIAPLMALMGSRAEVEVREILQAGIEAGEFQPVNPYVAAHLLNMAISRINEPDFQVITGVASVEGLREAMRVFEVGIVRRDSPASGRKRTRGSSRGSTGRT
jgi:AcrR family transcriptional regulator